MPPKSYGQILRPSGSLREGRRAYGRGLSVVRSAVDSRGLRRAYMRLNRLLDGYHVTMYPWAICAESFPVRVPHGAGSHCEEDDRNNRTQGGVLRHGVSVQETNGLLTRKALAVSCALDTTYPSRHTADFVYGIRRLAMCSRSCRPPISTAQTTCTCATQLASFAEDMRRY